MYRINKKCKKENSAFCGGGNLNSSFTGVMREKYMHLLTIIHMMTMNEFLFLKQ